MYFRPFDLPQLLAAAVGLLFSILVILFEIRLERASLKRLIGAAVGSKLDEPSLLSDSMDLADEQPGIVKVRSLRELIDTVSGKQIVMPLANDSGLADVIPFPFLGIVGQTEMKLALVISLINPVVAGCY